MLKRKKLKLKYAELAFSIIWQLDVNYINLQTFYMFANDVKDAKYVLLYSKIWQKRRFDAVFDPPHVTYHK